MATEKMEKKKKKKKKEKKKLENAQGEALPQGVVAPGLPLITMLEILFF